MRTIMQLTTVLALMSGSNAWAQSTNFQMLNADERLEALKVGVNQICVPTQSEQKTTKQVVRERGKAAGLRRMRSTNKTTALMWQVSKTQEVAIIEMGQGCTVSTSFESRDSDKLLPGLTAWLSEGATVQEMQPPPQKNGETGVTAFCRPNEEGGVDAVVLYEALTVERPDVGSKRPVDVKYLSIVVPPQTFCS